jgi:hypothetical protein
MRSGIVGAVTGIAFAVLLFLTVAVVDAPRGASDQEVLSWWAGSGNQSSEVASMYFALLAGLSFLVFLGQFCARLRGAEGERGVATSLVFAGGVVFVGLLFIAGLTRGAIALAVKFGDEPLPGVDVLRLVPEVSYVALGAYGMIVAAFMIAAASWAVLQSGVLARWFGWAGVAASAALLSSVVIGPFLIPVLLLWTLGASVAMWRGQRVAAGDGQPSVARS